MSGRQLTIRHCIGVEDIAGAIEMRHGKELEERDNRGADILAAGSASRVVGLTKLDRILDGRNGYRNPGGAVPASTSNGI